MTQKFAVDDDLNELREPETKTLQETLDDMDKEARRMKRVVYISVCLH